MRVTQGQVISSKAIYDGIKRPCGFFILACARLCYPQNNKVARAFYLLSPPKLTNKGEIENE